MKVVGVTGGIGSGKSTVCKVFQVLGIPVFNSDDESKKILFSDEVTQLVVDKFGDTILSNGQIDKSKLAKVVFNEPLNLEWLNQLLHPKVKDAFEAWVAIQHTNYIIKEAAILIESGAHKSCDVILNVACPEEIRVQRVLKRDLRTEEEVLKIVKKQLSEEERKQICDFTIQNNKEKIIPQILDFHAQMGSKSM